MSKKNKSSIKDPKHIHAKVEEESDIGHIVVPTAIGAFLGNLLFPGIE